MVLASISRCWYERIGEPSGTLYDGSPTASSASQAVCQCPANGKGNAPRGRERWPSTFCRIGQGTGLKPDFKDDGSSVWPWRRARERKPKKRPFTGPPDQRTDRDAPLERPCVEDEFRLIPPWGHGPLRKVRFAPGRNQEDGGKDSGRSSTDDRAGNRIVSNGALRATSQDQHKSEASRATASTQEHLTHNGRNQNSPRRLSIYA